GRAYFPDVDNGTPRHIFQAAKEHQDITSGRAFLNVLSNTDPLWFGSQFTLVLYRELPPSERQRRLDFLGPTIYLPVRDDWIDTDEQGRCSFRTDKPGGFCEAVEITEPDCWHRGISLQKRLPYPRDWNTCRSKTLSEYLQ